MPAAMSPPGERNAAVFMRARSVPDPVLGGWDDRQLALAGVVGRARRHAGQLLDVNAAVEALPLDALPIAAEDAATHVGIERRGLHAHEARRLLDRQVLLPVDDRPG